MLLPTSLSELRVAIDSVHDTQAVFRVLLDALSQPGVVHTIPTAAADAPSNPWLTSVLLTLLDHETSFATLSDPATDAFVRARTNARMAAPSDADFVLADSDSLTAALMLDLKRGSLAYPDDSATLIVDVLPETYIETVHFTGAGVPDARDVRLALTPELRQALADANANYPCGIDMVLIDGSGNLIGLPRTTRLGGI